MQGERAQATPGDLLLDHAAGPHEDRRGARLVDRDAGARDLGVGRASQCDELAGRIDDRDEDAVSFLDGELLGRGDDGVRAVDVDDPACTYD